MDKGFMPVAVSLPPEGRDVEFWTGGAAHVGYRKDGHYWIGSQRVVVEGWRPVKRPEAGYQKPAGLTTITVIAGSGGGGAAASVTGGVGGAGEYKEPAKRGRKPKASA